MSIGLRVLLFVISILTMIYIVRKIRKSELSIEHSLFWLGFSVLLVFLSIFPQVVYALTRVIGVQSPVNFVFLVIIFVLIIKNFMMTIEISKLENRIKMLVQTIALRETEEKERLDDEAGEQKKE